MRLWTGSALAALLVHLAAIALLFLHIPWPSRPQPLAGTPAALDVILASPPSSVPSAPSSSLGLPLQSRQEHSPSKSPELAVEKPLQSLAEVQPISEEVVQTHSNAAPHGAAVATGPASELSPLATPDLLVLSQSQGEVETPLSPAQQWLAQIKALLERYKQYPPSARKKKQQDTVRLDFSVDPTGKLTYVRIDSAHHYRALEQEVRRMLRQAGPLPAPPAQVPVDKIVWGIPVDFKIPFQTPSPVLIRCFAPENPGRAPSGATATRQQMQAYRERLSQYLVAGGNQLDCLSLAPGAIALQSRKTLTRQLHALVDNFNAQAQLFRSHAQALALQWQQAHQRQLQAVAARVYSGCTSPAALRAPAALTADTAQPYRRDLVAYQNAVRAYIACIREAQRVAAAPERGLAGDQRARLDQIGVQLGDAAIQSFNQLAAGFNGQVPRLRQQIATQTQQQLAEALVRASRIFPNSTWNVPAPLPPDECFRIIRSGQTYQGQICQSTYVTPLNASTQMARTMGARGGLLAATGQGITLPGDAGLARATQQEQIAASHGVAGDPGLGSRGPPILGIAVAPSSQAGQQTGTQMQTDHYAVSDLQVAGRRVSLTIGPVHFDLALAPDNQTLHGYCWTVEQRRECTLTRHTRASSPEKSPR